MQEFDMTHLMAALEPPPPLQTGGALFGCAEPEGRRRGSTPLVAVRATLFPGADVVFVLERDEAYSLDAVHRFISRNVHIFPLMGEPAQLRVIATWHNRRRFMKWVERRTRPRRLVGWYGPWRLAG